MKVYKEEDYLMLSGIQHFAFCKRQWALIVPGEGGVGLNCDTEPQSDVSCGRPRRGGVGLNMSYLMVIFVSLEVDPGERRGGLNCL